MMMEATLPQRSARHARKSAETDISLSLTLDGSGKTDIQTGFGMLDHMLTLTAFWAGMDLRLRCRAICTSTPTTAPRTSAWSWARPCWKPWGTVWASPVWATAASPWMRP